jgi:type 1 glutamine amidotransferase
MKQSHLTAILTVLFALPMAPFASAGESGDALKPFARYEQGKPLAILIEARREIFRGTADPAVRVEREAELLAFIASDAHPQAKAIAIEWLGCLGGTLSASNLNAAAKDPALAAPLAAALEHIQGQKTDAAAKPVAPTISKNAAEVAAFSAALDGKSGSGVDEKIADALRSPNELLAGSALRRLRAGFGSPALTKRLLDSIDQLPVSRQIPLCEALATRADAADKLHAILQYQVESGDTHRRVAALKAFGRILRPADLPLVLSYTANTATPGLSAAAKAAMSRATDPAIDPALIDIAGSDTTNRIAAIDALAARNAISLADRLWPLTTVQDSQVSAAAYRALGTLLPPDAIPEILKKLAATKDAPVVNELGKLLWNVVRRHPDPAAAAALLDQQAAQAPAAIKELLIRQAARIRPKEKKPANPAKPAVQLSVPSDRTKLSPNGHQQVAYLDCGSRDPSSGNDIVIRRTAGEPYQFGSTAHPLATMDFGNTISYEITGLVPGAEYVIGFSAWDADLNGRHQTFSVNGTVLLGDFAPLAYHADKPTCTRIHLPLPAALISGGKASVSMQSLAGPNAVISELWLLRRHPDSTCRKRVLILTGDDFQGHLWRETGPEFAAILRADPRLEVTISESPYLLESPVLSSYDAVFLHFKNYETRLPTKESLWKNLDAYVRGGGGLVIAHFGCGAMQEWNGFVNVAGRVWDPKKRAHDPYGEFMVRILPTAHPVTKGLADFKTRDELYTCLGGDTKIEVLADAVSKADKKAHPMAFALTPGKGRVFHSPLGHDLGALEAQGARALYLQGTLWAAGL